MSFLRSILLSVNGIAKISDFGIAHIFDEERKSFLQTPYSKDYDAIDEFLSDDEDDNEGGNKKEAGVDEAESPTHLSKRESEEAINMSSKHSSGLLQKTEGTLFFYSPEMCASEKSVFSGYAADLWAAGVCLHTFITGKLPFFSLNPGELFDMILSKDVQYDTLDLSNNSTSLLQKLLVKDPSLRAGVGDCLKHDYLKDARAQRIRQLGAEFEQSTRDHIVLTDTDINLALSITLRSYVFPKPTHKQSSGLSAGDPPRDPETKRTHSKIMNKSVQLNKSPSTAERVVKRPTRSPFLKGLFKSGYFGKKK